MEDYLKLLTGYQRFAEAISVAKRLVQGVSKKTQNQHEQSKSHYKQTSLIFDRVALLSRRDLSSPPALPPDERHHPPHQGERQLQQAEPAR